MKKTYLLLATVCLIVCAVLNISSPINENHRFTINANALSEQNGFEQDVTEKIEANISSLEETPEKIDSKISENITKQAIIHGSGHSFKIEDVKLETNIAKNIGVEDDFVEKVPETVVTEKDLDIKNEISVSTNGSQKFKTPYSSNVIEQFDTNASNVTYLGNFKLTAYCPCTQCCDKWGENRPVDEDGYTIVGTASGARAYANHTIAVDPSVIPYGTTVIIERNGVFYKYVAEDCGGSIKNKRIDVYFDSHSTACDFGVRYGNVYIVNG